MDDEIKTLVDKVTDHLKTNYKKNQHHVAALLQCGDTSYLALHLDIQGFDVCAEPIAISNALANDETDFQYIVAVIMNADGSIGVVNPCGNCRQMLLQYCPDVQVITQTPEGVKLTPANTLLPWPY